MFETCSKEDSPNLLGGDWPKEGVFLWRFGLVTSTHALVRFELLPAWRSVDCVGELLCPIGGCAHRGGHAVAALAPERVHVTSNVPSAAWPVATGDDIAVDAAHTRAVFKSTSTNENR